MSVRYERERESETSERERERANFFVFPTFARTNRARMSSAPLLPAGAADHDDAYYCGVPKSMLFKTGPDGLSEEEAERRLEKFGPNQLVEKKDNPLLKLLLAFVSPMAIMIWIAIAIEAVINDWPDFFVLLTLQILNSTVGWFEDWKAGNAVAALKNALKPECQVIRNGQHKKMDATLLVPGDRVTLAPGAAVPADCEIAGGITARSLFSRSSVKHSAAPMLRSIC